MRGVCGLGGDWCALCLLPHIAGGLRGISSTSSISAFDCATSPTQLPRSLFASSLSLAPPEPDDLSLYVKACSADDSNPFELHMKMAPTTAGDEMDCHFPAQIRSLLVMQAQQPFFSDPLVARAVVVSISEIGGNTGPAFVNHQAGIFWVSVQEALETGTAETLCYSTEYVPIHSSIERCGTIIIACTYFEKSSNFPALILDLSAYGYGDVLFDRGVRLEISATFEYITNIDEIQLPRPNIHGCSNSEALEQQQPSFEDQQDTGKDRISPTFQASALLPSVDAQTLTTQPLRPQPYDTSNDSLVSAGSSTSPMTGDSFTILAIQSTTLQCRYSHLQQAL